MAFFEQRNITKNEARKLLGSKYANLSDREIERLLDFIYILCTKEVIKVLERRHGKEKVSDLL